MLRVFSEVSGEYRGMVWTFELESMSDFLGSLEKVAL